jgi:serine/threonine-protein kinase
VLNRLVRSHFQERYQTATEVLAALPSGAHRSKLWQRFGQLFRSAPPTDADATQALPADFEVPPTYPLRVPAQPAPSSIEASADEVGAAITPLPPGTISPNKSAASLRIFISYRQQEPDLALAQQFFTALQTAGHHPFLSGQSGQWGPDWAEQVETELSRCDCFLLLLSPNAALSEMVLAEVRTVKRFQDQRLTQKEAGSGAVLRPSILPIRVKLPIDAPLNFELRGYLHRLQQRIWSGPEDTPGLIQDLLNTLGGTAGALASAQPTSGNTGGGFAIPTMPPAVVDPDAPPLPVAEPELPEGQVELASGFYLQRPPIEERCFETIRQPGALIRIKAPRQMGKTSLMARILAEAGQAGYRAVPLSFQLADAKIFTDLDKFLRWLCVSVGRRLGLTNQLQEYWDDIFGSKYNCTAYFEEYLLPQINQPLALGLDEVDRVFEYPEIASDFFGLLRAWHEEAKNREVWKNLCLVVVHATEVYIPLNTNQSPFNVGLPIELPEFNREQIAELARRHDLAWQPAQIDQLYRMIGGHPYLVRLALYHLARQDLSLEQLLAKAPTETGLFRDHLRGQWWHLQHHPELATAFRQVIQAPDLVRLETMDLFKLHSLGLIQLEGNEARLRCQLYRDYFAAMLNPSK